MKDNLILVVDDDENIQKIVCLYLKKEGFEVETAANGRECLDKVHEHSPSLVILDIMMPVMNGIDAMRELRKTSDVPVLMLTAKGETFDKVLGLELGADDYIVKPFDPKELIARVKAVLRRYTSDDKQDNIVEYEGLKVNIGDYTVIYNGEELDFPPKELELLYYLASHPNKVFTREQLLHSVWDFEFYGDSRTVDVHIKRVREKINGEHPWQIKTVWGVGYKFEIK